MKRLNFLVTLALVLSLATPGLAGPPREVVVDDLNGTYTTLASTIFGPQNANPAAWPWVFFGFGPPASGAQESSITSPNDPALVGSDFAWRYNMPNESTASEPTDPFAALFVWFNQTWPFGGTPTWDPLDTYLINMGELPVDWQEPVTFLIDVYGVNSAAGNTWRQRLVIDQASPSVIDTTNAAVDHIAGATPEWHTLSVVLNGEPNPANDSRFLLGLAVDFAIPTTQAGENSAIFDYLRIDYTPQALLFTEGDGTEVDEEGPTSDTYDVQLTAQPTLDVMVTFSTDGQCEIISPADLIFTFTPGNWDIPQTVTVRAIDDSDLEDPVHECVVTHSLSSPDDTFDGLSEDLTVAVLDNDQLPQGQPCSRGEDCISTFCVDDVCCVSDQCAEMEACNVLGSEGVCTATLPQGAQCSDGTQCESTFCTDDVCCVSDQCAEMEACNVSGSEGVCRATLPQGAQCSDGTQCESTFCADGFCCDSACAGSVDACNLPGSEGICALVPVSAPSLSWAGLLAGLSALVLISWYGILARNRSKDHLRC